MVFIIISRRFIYEPQPWDVLIIIFLIIEGCDTIMK